MVKIVKMTEQICEKCRSEMVLVESKYTGQVWKCPKCGFGNTIIKDR